MLINFSRLGFLDKAQELSNSVNGYLNTYKNHMATSLRAIDYLSKPADANDILNALVFIFQLVQFSRRLEPSSNFVS